MGEAPAREEGTVTRSAEYIGSFPVDDRCLDDQIELLHKHLKSLKRCKRSRPVCLKFSIKGVKMYDEDETTLLMAHALRRVSLSTARPADAQFAFVSHNPGSIEVQLYCHVFKARHARAAQFLNLLLCRCFQLSYLEKHPEEAQEYSASTAPQRNPSLLNHGFPLSVSALVSFRRAPFRGLFPGTKKHEKPNDESPASHDEVFTSSPSLVRKKAIRTKVLRSGAYRSFTFTPLKQRRVQERLGASQEKDLDKVPVTRSRAPSLAETEEALAQAVWCWDGIAADSSYSLLADDVLGSYFLCLNPKKQSKRGTLIVRFPSGLITHLIGNTRKGKFVLEKCKTEFDSIAELLEHYSQTQDGLPCLLSCTRVNHCYEWEENSSKPTVVTRSNQGKLKSTRKREPLNI